MTLALIQRFLTASDASPRHSADWRFHAWAFALLATSSIVPFIHYGFLNDATYWTRGPGILTPLPFLLLRSFGQLSAWLPVAVTAYWLLALRVAWLRSPGAVTTLAVVLCVFIGFYAWYCAALLNFQIAAYGAP